MKETANSVLRGCLIAIAIGSLVALAFLAGYVSGNKLAATPVAALPADKAEEELVVTPAPIQTSVEAEEELPPGGAPATAVVHVTRIVTATPPETVPVPTPTASEAHEGRSPDEATLFDLYWEVWALIEQSFYGELPSEEDRVYGAIRGSLQTLDDDYTSFIEPDLAEVSRNDIYGSFEGIGATVHMNEGDQLEILLPLEGQPAEIAGLKAGDIVLAVDGESIEGLGLYEAIALIRGPKGTSVVLTVWRPGETEPFDLEIVRDRIPLPTIDWEMLEDNIGYIWLYEFNAQATVQLRNAVKELRAREAEALILDLRDNPGGFLSQAVSVADEFLPEGVVLYERGRNLEEVFESTSAGLAEDIPLVILINGGSASASEIVAGAIQDRGRGILIGETSLGKGSVQQPRTLSDGSELRITIARWFTPDNRAIHGSGLEPDIVVPLTEEDYENDRDPQLDRAIDYLISGE